MTTKEEEIRRLSVRVAEMERTLETLQAEASDMMETLAVSQADMLIMYRRLQQISLALDESIHLLAEVNEGCRVFQKAHDETCAEKALQKETHRDLVASMNQTMDALMERNRQMQMQGLTMVGLCYQNAQRKKTTKEPERRMATTKGKRKNKNNDKDEEEDDKKRSNKRMMKTKQQKGEGGSSNGYDDNNNDEGEDSSSNGDDDKKNEGGELFVIASDTFKNKVFFGYGDEDTDDFITRLNKAALLCMPEMVPFNAVIAKIFEDPKEGQRSYDRLKNRFAANATRLHVSDVEVYHVEPEAVERFFDEAFFSGTPPAS